MAILNVQKPANPSTNELEVNSGTAAGAAGQSIAYNANVAAGNLLVVLIAWTDVNALAASSPVTDTLGNTWLLAQLEQGNGNTNRVLLLQLGQRRPEHGNGQMGADNRRVPRSLSL